MIAKSQFTMLTFHWMKIGSLNTNVAPPRTTTNNHVKSNFFSMFPLVNFSYPTCKVRATISTPVAKITSLVKIQAPANINTGRSELNCFIISSHKLKSLVLSIWKL